MKKILVLVSMLVIAAACAAPPTNQPALDTNRNANLAATSAPAVTEADATAKEKAIWEAIKQKDYTAFADMLADDQVEVLSDGVHDKAASVAGVKDFEPSEVNFSDWKYLPIDKDGFIIAYTVAMKGKFKGKEFPLETYHASSAWMRRNSKWLAVFHQECKVKKMPPPPPAPKVSPKPAASPAATPLTATTGPDAIANEQLVWDLFKSKNFDAFATLLAPEFLEVEPDGYYDKAASVKALSSMMDMSKTVSSDFKASKFSETTALVTYMLKDPAFAPKGERHSTIWVNRAGKWLGLLHHGGTAVETPPAASMAKPTASPATK